MQVIKLGGSIVTCRDHYVYDQDNVRSLAKQLLQSTEPTVIVHGMGSFGRAFVPLYEGMSIPKVHFALARKIQQELRELHHMVAISLQEAGLLVRSFDPESVFAMEAGRITFSTMELITYALKRGQVPVLHGGTFADDNGDFTILSSDQMVEHLAERLGASRVIWATDVDGVLDDGEQVIEHLHRNNLQLMWRQNYDLTDRTGGMTNKVKISLRLAERGIESFVINGRSHERLRALFIQEPVTCTLIKGVG